ncbi:undecaprenyldiphospho-muramoylpentapeptide beta-N-acetylglucosaminyltransferase [Limnohabitans sp. Rim8]|uniref:undecaprenyldiphospho-muramoylpentapeptide beta-N-acetylglucosaminyltransferase n=1 Tax=Limnohabitans sp. Rim8 TaxID=1100718 RepID=UPI002625E345|nr:undecaprenyldiphospho-muramoylpentapeptide beta-N-acetylglucosaminyltransferase [Limnohabitans sp. Rim8]
MTTQQKTALVMAGGTGGHIFPGLAVAEALREAGWQVHWLGAPNSMEHDLVPARGFAFEPVAFGGVRGKGIQTLALLPLRLLRAFWQSLQVVRRVQPDVVLGLGGYISFPGGMMASLWGKPLVLHEQNSVPGLANKILSQLADRVFTAFPGVFKTGQWVGNPLRRAFTAQASPAERFAGRTGPLRLLVVGGSLGAKALNDFVPQALALMSADKRPVVIHQSGAKQIDALRSNYQAAGVEAELTPFIDDTASAFAQADVVICRAGASTVTELAAVGAAALFVPFPFAVDDHQTTNAQFLVAAGGGWLTPQAELNAQGLADWLSSLDRAQLLAVADKASAQKKIQATREILMACEELAA